MNGENQPLVIDEPVEAQKDFRNITHFVKRICGINLELIKKIQNMTTCNRLLDLETLGFWPIMPQKSPRTLTITLNCPHSLGELLNDRLLVESPHLYFACKNLRNFISLHMYLCYDLGKRWYHK
jgi:hypothetical protein